ncbi:hypothetical protein EU523_00545 [Candidatus Heimdallarchaeota archaeon]|nr:MAG: hypothetical protein EU523_00545 [Candidatus Heimdallarchaeota archaeon]
MKNKISIFGIFILAIMFLSMGIASALPTDLLPPEVLDPGDGSSGGPGGGTKPGTRVWKYTWDEGTDQCGDLHLKYVVTEQKVDDGWEITYQVDIDYYYFYTNDYVISIHRYCGGGYWYRAWIGSELSYNDEAYEFTTTEEEYNSYIHEYIHHTETIHYDSDFEGDFMGIRGGVICMDDWGNFDLQYGCVLQFRIGESDYRDIISYSDWHAGGEILYGFFGQLSGFRSFSFPPNAWYNNMDVNKIYIQ